MNSRILQKIGVRPTIMTLGLFLLGSTFSYSQTERSIEDSPETIPLKNRTEFSSDQKIDPTEERTDNYLLLHFEDRIASNLNLTELNIIPINYIDKNSIYAFVPLDADLTTLESYNWGATLLPSDKVQTQLYSNFTGTDILPILIYLPSNLTDTEINNFKSTLELDWVASESLPNHIVLAKVNETKMEEVALHNYVSWILEAPLGAVYGEKFHFCPGAMTPYGPYGEFSNSNQRYVLQGSDWDGPGLGCADLTYHFENGTPDIAGTAEWTVVRNAMDEWKNYAGLTFTETATVGLSNSIDISWVSGDHGDGSPFDGPSGTLAHAFYPQYGGELHFDEAENWTTSGGGIDLYAVAVHELGHALGLNHSDNGSAVMAPYYAGAITGLHSDDIAGIQAIYSSTPCGGGAYCASQGTNSSYEWINTITVAGNTNASGNNSGYGDFTSATPISLAVGASNAVSLSPGFSGTTYTEYWRIWVDYDKNNVFESSELVYSGTGTGTKTGSFTVPTGLSGTTRMRVSMKYGGYPTPCETFAYGEVEDYTVSLDAAALTYCDSKGSNSSYEWIANVTMGGYVNTSGNDGGYKDNTGLVFPLSTGSSAVSLSPGFSGTTYMEYWNIWIDLNLNGVFDASELLYSGSGTSTVTGSMNIPTTYGGITTRARISMKYNGTPTACETFTYGEVEDYTITIAAAPITLDNSADDVLIYPNPVAGNALFIQSPYTQPNYQIFDATGKIVSSGILTGNELNIEQLSNGHYILRLITETESVSKSFIRR